MATLKYLSSKDSKWTPIIFGVENGGTGITSNPSVLINLASTNAANIFDTEPRPGVTGTLPVNRGGTGATSFTTNQVVLSNASTTTGALRTTAASGTGAFYRTSATAAPTFATLPVGQGGSGMTASKNTNITSYFSNISSGRIDCGYWGKIGVISFDAVVWNKRPSTFTDIQEVTFSDTSIVPCPRATYTGVLSDDSGYEYNAVIWASGGKGVISVRCRASADNYNGAHYGQVVYIIA